MNICEHSAMTLLSIEFSTDYDHVPPDQIPAGVKVLVLLSIPGNPLQAKFRGPYVVEQQLVQSITLLRPRTEGRPSASVM